MFGTFAALWVVMLLGGNAGSSTAGRSSSGRAAVRRRPWRCRACIAVAPRAGRLPAAAQAQRAHADRPDLRHRRLVRARRGHGSARQIAAGWASTTTLNDYVSEPRNNVGLPDDHRRRSRSSRIGDYHVTNVDMLVIVGRDRHDGRAGPVRPAVPARPRHPGGRPGPRGRRADGRQPRPGHPGHLPARRPDGRRGRGALHAAHRHHPVRRRLPPRRQGVHRRGARRHRQPARRPARWPRARPGRELRLGAVRHPVEGRRRLRAADRILLFRPTGLLGESLGKARA